MDQFVDIAFDCLPLRLIGRVDIPIDASPGFRERGEKLRQAIERHGSSSAYFLYNSRCVYRLANSEIEGMLRFTFDGTLVTDISDAKAERADLDVRLAAETCGPVPPAVLSWFQQIVTRAVLIEFDRFIAAGSLAARVHQLGKIESIASVSDFSGMNL